MGNNYRLSFPGVFPLLPGDDSTTAARKRFFSVIFIDTDRPFQLKDRLVAVAAENAAATDNTLRDFLLDHHSSRC